VRWAHNNSMRRTEPRAAAELSGPPTVASTNLVYIHGDPRFRLEAKDLPGKNETLYTIHNQDRALEAAGTHVQL